MKIYLVNKIDSGEYAFSDIQKIFLTSEKAQAYVEELNKKYKDNISFQYSHFYFEIEEMEVE